MGAALNGCMWLIPSCTVAAHNDVCISGVHDISKYRNNKRMNYSITYLLLFA